MLILCLINSIFVYFTVISIELFLISKTNNFFLVNQSRLEINPSPPTPLQSGEGGKPERVKLVKNILMYEK